MRCTANWGVGHHGQRQCGVARFKIYRLWRETLFDGGTPYVSHQVANGGGGLAELASLKALRVSECCAADLDVGDQVAVDGGGVAGRLVLVPHVRDDRRQLVHRAPLAALAAQPRQQLFRAVALGDADLHGQSAYCLIKLAV